jgi:hypothetical protein
MHNGKRKEVLIKVMDCFRAVVHAHAVKEHALVSLQDFANNKQKSLPPGCSAQTPCHVMLIERTTMLASQGDLCKCYKSFR